MTRLLEQDIPSDVLSVHELEDVMKKRVMKQAAFIFILFFPPTEHPQMVSQLQLIHKQNGPSQY